MSVRTLVVTYTDDTDDTDDGTLAYRDRSLTGTVRTMGFVASVELHEMPTRDALRTTEPTLTPENADATYRWARACLDQMAQDRTDLMAEVESLRDQLAEKEAS